MDPCSFLCRQTVLGVTFFVLNVLYLLFFLIKKVTKKSRQNELLRSFCQGLRTSCIATGSHHSRVIATYSQGASSLDVGTGFQLNRPQFVHSEGAAIFRRNHYDENSLE